LGEGDAAHILCSTSNIILYKTYIIIIATIILWYGRDSRSSWEINGRRASRTMNKLQGAFVVCDARARPMLTIIINNRGIKYNTTPYFISHTCGAEHYWWCLFFKRFSSFSQGASPRASFQRNPPPIIRKTRYAQRP